MHTINILESEIKKITLQKNVLFCKAICPKSAFFAIFFTKTAPKTSEMQFYHQQTFLRPSWKVSLVGSKLCLRNIASTTISQLVDTILFITLTFSILPSIVGIGIGLPLSVIVQLILGQYLVKLLIALADTPLIYAFFSYLKKENLIPS